ncbi:MAG: ArsR/SmtB family transcription factor [Nitriliruptoraceae bacterium]
MRDPDPAPRPVEDGGTTPIPDPLELDLSALKALTHPLRVRMYDLLADDGPATASQLATALGESSGTTSYHLRVLARHGLIEEDADRGDRRDRWWRVRRGGYKVDARRFRHDPVAEPVLDAVAGQLWRQVARHLETWYRTAPRWDDAWVAASASTTLRLQATPEELAALRDEVVDVLARHRDRLQDREPPPDATRVMVQVHAFPLPRPTGKGSSADA